MRSPAPPVIEGGAFLADKPSGWTSHDVVAVVRRITGISQIGHSGTLDPLATGLLVLLIGRATKRQAEFQMHRKSYSGVMRFGAETDTWDAQGRVLFEKPVPAVTQEQISEMLSAVKGDISQPVPPYSAVKLKGTPMHRLARRGKLPESVVSKNVKVYGWSDVKWTPPDLSFTVECSSGTYVRAFAHVLGEKLGCGAHLTALRRLSVGDFNVKDAFPVTGLKEAGRDAVMSRLIPLK